MDSSSVSLRIRTRFYGKQLDKRRRGSPTSRSSDPCGHVVLVVTPGHSGATHLVPGSDVAVTTLDRFFADEGLSRVDLIKSTRKGRSSEFSAVPLMSSSAVALRSSWS